MNEKYIPPSFKFESELRALAGRFVPGQPSQLNPNDQNNKH